MSIAAAPAESTVSVAEQNIKHNRTFWAKYPWPQDGDEWSAAVGGSRAMWETIIRPRISSFIPAGSILEIAPGHGRCTQFLLEVCDRLTIVDLVPECINACRNRFGERAGLTYAVNDGSTLPMVGDRSIDFAFTWDSLVHVEHDTMRSYTRELSRVLKPGGYAFIHHSNLGAYADRIGEFNWDKDLHGRGKTMSAAAMRSDCAEFGLSCLAQELVPWGTTGLFIDAFSLLWRDPSANGAETTIEERPDWGIETKQARRIGRLYNR